MATRPRRSRGVVMPAGVPRPILEKVSAALQEVIAGEEASASLAPVQHRACSLVDEEWDETIPQLDRTLHRDPPEAPASPSNNKCDLDAPDPASAGSDFRVQFLS